MLQILLLVLAAILEVGGDVMIRHGLKNHGIAAMVCGAVVLAVYGFLINATKFDFGRMMGIYIVLFFVASQLAAVLVFNERLHLPVLIGGGFIVVGGVLMMVLKSA